MIEYYKKDLLKATLKLELVKEAIQHKMIDARIQVESEIFNTYGEILYSCEKDVDFSKIRLEEYMLEMAEAAKANRAEEGNSDG